jgi:hypothetical protein
MARYGLIIKDDSYVKFVEIAARKGITLGRLFNDVLEGFLSVQGNVKDIGRVCHYCHEKPVFSVILNNMKLFVCQEHFEKNKKAWGAWKKLEE